MLNNFFYTRTMNMLHKLVLINLIILLSISSSYANELTLRKYNNVKIFYDANTKDAIEIAKKYRLPPAALLAIAGLESGYGSGYVAQITGNILSLGAFKSDAELPALYLPYSKSKKMVLFDPNQIKKYTKDDLIWKMRPKSLKRDYRPAPYAGTKDNLAMLLYDKKLKYKANQACFIDFSTRWIVKSSNIKAFKDTRIWLDALVKKKGIEILFSEDTNNKFISKIGGHPNSFNYRKSWPKKVKFIMDRAGLVNLTKNMEFKDMNFTQAWEIK